MPIPVITDHYLAQVIMRPDTLPESNTFVNTLFFRDVAGGRSHAVVANDIETVVEQFYNSVAPPATITVAAQISAIVDPSLTELRVYDLGQPAPRDPEIRGMGSWIVGTGALPNEVAAVLSFRSGSALSPTGGTINKRARGRIYLGPLSSTASSFTAGDTDTTLVTVWRTAIVEAAKRMRDQVAVDVEWMQYSRAGNVMAAVTQGFVNNRFDTQRRRGAESTSRTVW